MPNVVQSGFSRRNFLQRTGQSLAVFAVANLGVYAVGSAFKELDGSLVAGAKCSPPGLEGNSCVISCSPQPGNAPGLLFCAGSIYQCAPCGSCGDAACN